MTFKGLVSVFSMLWIAKGNNECLNDNGGCSQTCINLPNGYECQCSDGYKLVNKRICEDIDECEIPGSCSQSCTNTEGGYKCGCIDGYMLEPENNRTCRAKGQTVILYNALGSIRKVDLETQEYVSNDNNLQYINSFDYNYHTKAIVSYAYTKKGRQITSTPIDSGSPVTTLVEGDFGVVMGIAVDWIYGNIYWTDFTKNRIEVVDKNGQFRKIVINDVSLPRTIALDPLNGWMYWICICDNSIIERAGMDGNDRASIVSSDDMEIPSSLALDFVTKRIFWADAYFHTLNSADYDGSNKKVVIKSLGGVALTYSLDVFEDLIYYTEFNKDIIHRANKFTGEKETGITRGINFPTDIHIFHSFKQPEGINYCNDGNCSHLCFPTPNVNEQSVRYTCACPDDLKLASDHKTCVTKIKNECLDDNGGCSQTCIDLLYGYECRCFDGYKLVDNLVCEDIDECEIHGSCSQSCTNTEGGYECGCIDGYMLDPDNNRTCRVKEGHALILYNTHDYIRKVDIETQEYESVVNHSYWSTSFNYNYKTKTIVWFVISKKGRKILSAPIDTGSPVSTLVAGNFGIVKGIAVDWIHGNIYWTDYTQQSIGVVDKKGQNRKILINYTKYPRAIALDPLNGWMYWTCMGGYSTIERAGMDGTHRATIVFGDTIIYPSSLALDFVTKRIFWADGWLHILSSADYDGRNRRVVMKSLGGVTLPDSLDVFEDLVYYTEWSKNIIHRANKITGEKKTAITRGINSPTDIHIFHSFKQPEGVNYCNHGNCSHLCLPSPNINVQSARYTCACPDHMVLAFNHKTCITKNLFYVAERTT